MHRCIIPSLLTSIKYLSPDYSPNYSIILKLCFLASNNSRIIFAKCQPIILQNYGGTLGLSLYCNALVIFD